MAADDKSWRDRLKRWSGYLAWSWQKCLDFALVLWIVRVPLCAVVIGGLILDYTVQAQDVLTEFSDHWDRMALFLVLLTVVWAATTHYAARLLLDTDSRFRAYTETRGSPFLTWAETWVPRLLGLAPYAIVLFASGRSVWNLPEIDDAGLIWGVKKTLYVFDGLVLIAGGAFFAYMVNRPALMKTTLVRCAEEKAASFINPLLQWFGLGGDGRISSRAGYKIQPGLGPLLLIIVFAISALIIFVGASRAAALFPRALILPIIFGGWLPLLTFLSGWGRQLRAPLIVASGLLIAGLSAIVGDNHSVRRVNASALMKGPVDAADSSTMQLNQALDIWMKKNGCADRPSSCPRPIIVVGAGGASRAGFFTASVIGKLLDEAGQHLSQGAPLDAAKIRNRIFAISALSGSAPGAVMTVAAFARAGPPTKQPCASGKPDLWYGEAIYKWQDCLEALMAGDFLTTSIIGLTFHDTIRFGWWQDRAALLERSWEQRFASVMNIDPKIWRERCPGDLRCPFMALRPKEDEKEPWLPLLLLNGASAATGQRLITTILNPKYIAPANSCPTERPKKAANELKGKTQVSQTYVTEEAPKKGETPPKTNGTSTECPIFMEATRFHTLLTDDTDVDFLARFQRYFLRDYIRELFSKGPKLPLDDVRLSTAASNSARFPVISPPGAVRNAKHNVIDRIVDGGYIENYGAITAMELAVAINAVQPELAPFVLIISNDPDENPIINKIDVPDAAFLTDVSIPLQAIASARDGRGRLAVQQLESVLDAITRRGCNEDTSHIRVWPQYIQQGTKKVSRPVSLSWWLSTPIQVHLHQQLESTKLRQPLKSGNTENPNTDDIKKTWGALTATSACMAARR
jgi:hypothetical protein